MNIVNLTPDTLRIHTWDGGIAVEMTATLSLPVETQM